MTQTPLLEHALANFAGAVRLLADEFPPELLTKIREPKERSELRLSPELADGRVHTLKAFVVHHNRALGPCKGGIRMTPTKETIVRSFTRNASRHIQPLVYVSYLEYTQETQQEQMTEAEVRSRLEQRMLEKFALVWQTARERGVSLRAAAMVLAVRHVALAFVARGSLP